MNDTTEQTAQRIAAHGREALLARLRPAFEEAATAHADVLELSPEQLEEMVQRAADRADGLQWRRALAAVATEELGIGLGEALSHPAVERAQEIVGAPSYEESLAKLGPLPQTQAQDEDQQAAQAEEALEAEPEPVEAEPEPVEAEPEPVEAVDPTDEPAEHEEPAEAARTTAATQAEEPEEPEEAGDEAGEEPSDTADAEARGDALDEHGGPATAEHASIREDNGAPPSSEELQPLRIAAVHLGGIANLAPAESDIQLEFSEHGLDVIRGSDTILGRLGWEDIRALEVPEPRGWRRRRQERPGHLVVRTDHGDASFEIPGLTSNDLRDHIEPVRKYLAA